MLQSRVQPSNITFSILVKLHFEAPAAFVWLRTDMILQDVVMRDVEMTTFQQTFLGSLFFQQCCKVGQISEAFRLVQPLLSLV